MPNPRAIEHEQFFEVLTSFPLDFAGGRILPLQEHAWHVQTSDMSFLKQVVNVEQWAHCRLSVLENIYINKNIYL